MPSALARNTDPGPAHEAAAAVTPHVTALERRVIFALCELGPATSHQVAAHTGMDLISVSPRMRPLCERGMIREAGEERVGRRPRTLWALVERSTEREA